MLDTIYTTDLVEQERKYFSLSASSRIVVSLFKTITQNETKKKIDIRLWYSRDGEKWTPTRKGVAIRADLVRDNLMAILSEYISSL